MQTRFLSLCIERCRTLAAFASMDFLRFVGALTRSLTHSNHQTMLLSLCNVYLKVRQISIPKWCYWLPMVILALPVVSLSALQYGPRHARESYIAVFSCFVAVHAMICVLLIGVFIHSLFIIRSASSQQTKESLTKVVKKLVPCTGIALVVLILQINVIIAVAKITSMNDRYFEDDNPTYSDHRIGCKPLVLVNTVGFDLAQVAITVTAICFYRGESRVRPEQTSATGSDMKRATAATAANQISPQNSSKQKLLTLSPSSKKFVITDV